MTDSGASDTTYQQKVAVALNDLPAIGLPELIYTDGPNGVRGADGATAFPSGLAVAASFDRDLATRFGEALARESLAAGRNGILGPGLDIARVSWGGRLAEALGEDPVLVGEIGAAIVRGIQRLGVLAVPKHYVANNFEYLRTGRGSFERRTPAVDVQVSPRALREVYAEPFRRALLNGRAGAVLSSYNRLGGKYVSENADVLAILRDEWGWRGFVTPDFLHAVRDDEAALRAGLDFPALGGTAGRTENMVRAVDEAQLDAIVERTRWALHGIGVLSAPPSDEPLNDAASQDLAEEILESGAVLLQNDGVLPLARTQSVALVGVADVEHLLVMGGSAAVTLSPSRIQSLAGALTAAGAAQVHVVPGSLGDIPLPTFAAPVRAVVRDDVTGVTAGLDLSRMELYAVPESIGPDWSATLSAEFVPDDTGPYRLTLTFSGEATLFVDGVDVASGFREASPMVQGPEYPIQALVELTAGQVVEIRAEYRTGPAFHIPPVVEPGVKVGILGPDDAMAVAADTAANADVAVVVVGRVSGEAMDVDALTLPGDQERLVRTVAAGNPRTVVITCGAGPVIMDWAPDVAAILHVWNPGERFAPALARMLFGDVEPGGRLPLTFPADETQTPVSTPERYPGMDGTVHYAEDLYVGYRWFHANEATPRFPFGHGLGYASHVIESAHAAVGGETCHVAVHVSNRSDRDGSTVVQVYVSKPPEADSPARTLVGFARTKVPAGSSQQVQVKFPLRDLAIWDAARHCYRVPSGSYIFDVGMSSADMQAAVAITLDEVIYPNARERRGAH